MLKNLNIFDVHQHVIIKYLHFYQYALYEGWGL